MIVTENDTWIFDWLSQMNGDSNYWEKDKEQVGLVNIKSSIQDIYILRDLLQI